MSQIGKHRRCFRRVAENKCQSTNSIFYFIGSLTISYEIKKTALIIMLFIYTVLCGIIIADCGTSAVAGSERPSLATYVINEYFSKPTSLK